MTLADGPPPIVRRGILTCGEPSASGRAVAAARAFSRRSPGRPCGCPAGRGHRVDRVVDHAAPSRRRRPYGIRWRERCRTAPIVVAGLVRAWRQVRGRRIEGRNSGDCRPSQDVSVVAHHRALVVPLVHAGFVVVRADVLLADQIRVARPVCHVGQRNQAAHIRHARCAGGDRGEGGLRPRRLNSGRLLHGGNAGRAGGAVRPRRSPRGRLGRVGTVM